MDTQNPVTNPESSPPADQNAAGSAPRQLFDLAFKRAMRLSSPAVIRFITPPGRRRFEMLNGMRSNGIKTIVWLSPFMPFINDTKENISRLLEYCVQARVYGVMCFGIGLTLREGNREYFYRKLDEHFPGLKKTYQKKYGLNYVIASENNNTLMSMIYETCARHNVVCNNDALFAYMGTFEEQKGQMEMF